MKLHKEHEALEGLRPQIAALSDNSRYYINRSPFEPHSITIEAINAAYPVGMMMGNFEDSHFSRGEKEVASSCLIDNCKEILQYMNGFGLSVDHHEFDEILGPSGAITLYRAHAHKNAWKLLHNAVEACDTVARKYSKKDKTIFHPKLSKKQEYFFQMLAAHINALKAIIQDTDTFQQRLLDVLDETY